MYRYARAFEKKTNFIPFVTIGDPDFEQSYRIVETLIQAGCDGLELGFAFSDPVADGPVVQAGNIRSLKSGFKIQKAFEFLKRLRSEYPDIPVGLLVYSNLIFAYGIESFYQCCARVEVDSVLIPDVPYHESKPFESSAQKYEVSSIFIVPPNIEESSLKAIVEDSKSFLYVVSRAGVTGVQYEASFNSKLIDRIRVYSPDIPCMLGFGVSEPAHFVKAVELGYHGVICGSKIVSYIASNLDDYDKMLEGLSHFVLTMKNSVEN